METGQYDLYAINNYSDALAITTIYDSATNSKKIEYYIIRKVPKGLSFRLAKEKPTNDYKPVCA